MELVERFQKYAGEFEKTYVDDDWSRIAALVHESESGTNFSPCLSNWLLHGERFWPAKFEHPIQDVARDQRFYSLGPNRAQLPCDSG